MTRQAIFEDRMTPFSQWIRTNCRDSATGLSVTNLDFEVEDFRDRKRKRTLLMEEKQYMGLLHYRQAQHFMRMDRAARLLADREGFVHWGFYLVQFSETCPWDSDVILVNGVELDSNQLRRLIDGDEMPVNGLDGNRPQEWRRFIQSKRW